MSWAEEKVAGEADVWLWRCVAVAAAVETVDDNLWWL